MAVPPANTLRCHPWIPKHVSGLQLLGELRDHLRVLPTGSSLIDGLLEQGVLEGSMIEVVGESSSGKSQLCMLFAATTALRGEGVVYIDTAAAFSPVRVAGLCRAMQASDVESNPPARRTRVLIVDSISAIITPILGGMQHSQGHTQMLSMSRMLKQLMQEFCLAVVVTNHVVSAGAASSSLSATSAAAAVAGDDPPPLQHRPALGEHWRNQANCRLMLAIEDDGMHSATLMSSTSPMVRQWPARFKISNSGFVAV